VDSGLRSPHRHPLGGVAGLARTSRASPAATLVAAVQLGKYRLSQRGKHPLAAGNRLPQREPSHPPFGLKAPQEAHDHPLPESDGVAASCDPPFGRADPVLATDRGKVRMIQVLFRLGHARVAGRTIMHKCPACHGDEVSPSHRLGFQERFVIPLILCRPYRCFDCGRRFFAFSYSKDTGKRFGVALLVLIAALGALWTLSVLIGWISAPSVRRRSDGRPPVRQLASVHLRRPSLAGAGAQRLLRARLGCPDLSASL